MDVLTVVMQRLGLAVGRLEVLETRLERLAARLEGLQEDPAACSATPSELQLEPAPRDDTLASV